MPVIQSYGSLGYWAIFLISFFEALVFAGSFIPGTPIILFYGFLASVGYFNVGDLFILAVAGAVAGDAVSFYLGTKSRNLFHEKNFLLNTKYLEKSQRFFEKYGDKSIFWSRFVAVIKPFIPFTAGVAGMNVKKFAFWNVFSALVWASSHLAAGYFFGGAFRVIETWTTRFGIFILVSAIFFWFLWFAIKKGERALEYTVSFVHSTGWSLVNSFPVRWFYHQFPKTYVFLAKRFNSNSFWGWPFTLLVSSLFIVSLSLFSLVKNILVSSPVVFLDTKIENILVVFRDSFLVKFFLWVTALGEYQVIISVVLITTALFWLWQKRFYIVSLYVTVIGSTASAYLAKIFINRSRPGGEIPVFTEHFFSFPSGHATVIIALLGFLTYCVWRNFKTWKIRVNSFFLASAIIILVGFSRLYLGVHFLSDVLGGYLMGFFWLLLGIAISEWLIVKSHRRGGEGIIEEIKTEKQVADKRLWLKFFTGLLVSAEVFYIGSFITSFRPIFNTIDQTAERQIIVRDISDPLFEKYIPKFPENLAGDYQTPLNFVIIADSDEVLKEKILSLGWTTADPINPKSFIKMLSAYFKEVEYDSAPVSPLFWHGQPNDFVFEKPVSGDELGIRYKVRFWKTDITTEEGGFVYVGSTELDINTEYIVFRITSSDLDIARDKLFDDMLDNQIISRYEKRLFVDSKQGKYFETGKYQTDGKAYFVYLK